MLGEIVGEGEREGEGEGEREGEGKRERERERERGTGVFEQICTSRCRGCTTMIGAVQLL